MSTANIPISYYTDTFHLLCLGTYSFQVYIHYTALIVLANSIFWPDKATDFSAIQNVTYLLMEHII